MTSNTPERGMAVCLAELLPKDLREPPPRAFATCRYARPETESSLAAVLLLLIIVISGLWGRAHGYEFASLGLLATVPLLLFSVSKAVNAVCAIRLAIGGVPVPATISDGTVRTRFGTFQVWRVRTEFGTVSIHATGRTVPGMVALVLGEQIGLYHPGPLRRGIHTSRVS